MNPQPKPVKRVKARRPLKRSPMKRRRARRVARKSFEEAAFLVWLHTQPCCAKGFRYCALPPYINTHWCHAGIYGGQPPIEAAHLRDMTGLGRKESDLTCIPLCGEAHRDFDQAKGIFKDTTKAGRKRWHRERQAEVQARWQAHQGGQR
jgi:hypothetical protein